MDKIADDVVTIIAIIIPAIVSIFAAMITVRVNRENIKAKRLDIAFDKRLEAYRNLAEQIGKILYFCSEEPLTDAQFLELDTFHRDLYAAQQKQRIFLTAQMDGNLSEFLSIMFEHIHKSPKDRKGGYEQFYKSLKKQGYAIFSEMHDLMGYA